MALKIIEERRDGQNYSVAYQSNDNTIKVVRINEGSFSLSKHTSQLRIQKSGIDLHFDVLDFEEGKAATHHAGGIYSGSMLPFVQEKQKELERLVKKYSEEFEEIFMSNQVLQEYLSTHFKDLNVEYLCKQQ